MIATFNRHLDLLFKKFLEDISSFYGATDIIVLNFWDVSSGFQSQTGQPLGGKHGSLAILFHVPCKGSIVPPLPRQICYYLPV